MPELLMILFLFLLGISVGSFLNVVAWRLPAGMSLIRPGSHCPKCKTPLGLRDNIPVFGWIFLAGKCRYCRQPISARYPIVEFVCGLLFVATYYLMFHTGFGPAGPDVVSTNRFGEMIVSQGALSLPRDGWVLGLSLFLISTLLVVSLIDADLFIIPLAIPFLMFVVGVIVHATYSRSGVPGGLVPTMPVALFSLGGLAGVIVSNGLVMTRLLKPSFAEGEPMLEHEKQAAVKPTTALDDETPIREYDRRQIATEMRLEMAWLMPPLVLAGLGAFLALRVPAMARLDAMLLSTPIVQGFIGAVFGALIGAACVWVTRILGSLAFGKEAMGMGDVHLMLGVGAILGAGPVTVAFFIAPIAGLPIALFLLIFARRRQIPFGPYLAVGSVVAFFIYPLVADYFRPGLQGLAIMLFGRG
jgi:leader peptidase (prepilin peptidase) / N-methyltransferase